MEEPRVPVQVMLPASIDEKLERIMKPLGLRSKSFLIESLLREVFDEVEEDQAHEADRLLRTSLIIISCLPSEPDAPSSLHC